jgi:hypothetical protein
LCVCVCENSTMKSIKNCLKREGKRKGR